MWLAPSKTPELSGLNRAPWVETLHVCCWTLPEEGACSLWSLGWGEAGRVLRASSWMPPHPAWYVPFPSPIPVMNHSHDYRCVSLSPCPSLSSASLKVSFWFVEFSPLYPEFAFIHLHSLPLRGHRCVLNGYLSVCVCSCSMCMCVWECMCSLYMYTHMYFYF